MLSKQTPRVHPLLPRPCVYVPSRAVTRELYLAMQYEVLRSSFHGGFHQAEYPTGSVFLWPGSTVKIRDATEDRVSLSQSNQM